MISKGEDAASLNQEVPIQSVLEKLDLAKSKLHPKLDASEISQIDDLAEQLRQSANEEGMIAPNELVKVTKSLQNKGSSAYGVSPSGAQLGSQAQQAAKNALQKIEESKRTNRIPKEIKE
jgi:hypothetical protein